MKLLLLFLLFLPFISAEHGLVGACKNKTITTAPNFDLSKYTGLWYEIAHSKSFYFDNECQNTTAEYTILKPDLIQVNNSCDKVDKGHTSVIGTAVPISDGYLRVYFNIFYGNYYVVYLTDDLSVSLVASCSTIGGSDLWILSRQKYINDIDIYKGIFEKKGFETDDLIKTIQV